MDPQKIPSHPKSPSRQTSPTSSRQPVSSSKGKERASSLTVDTNPSYAMDVDLSELDLNSPDKKRKGFASEEEISGFASEKDSKKLRKKSPTPKEITEQQKKLKQGLDKFLDNYPGVKHETTRDKMKKERKEYVNKMIDLDNNSPKEFQGLELVNSQEVENEKFQNQTKKLIGKKRKNVKPFKHMGTKEEQIPMLQKLLKEEAGVKEEAGEPEPANNFLETCTGTGQFLTQAPYQHFTIADLDDNVTNFYKVANKDPHNLEISGRVTKGKLKKQQDWANVWDETKKKVNPENEATTDSEKAEKAAAFMLYRNAKKNDYTTDENYEEKPQDFKKGSHKMAYQKDDMKVLLHQLDKLPETEIVTDKFQNTLQKYGSNKDLIYIDPPYVKFTYSEKPPEKENSSTGQYSHGMSYEEQTQSIEQLGEIVKQKSLEESNTKPQVIGYSNMATLDLVKHCIDSGATKIYLYTKRRQKGFHVEMLAIFKGTTSKDSQTLAQKKVEKRKNWFNQMEEGKEAGREPEKKVIENREFLKEEMSYLTKELVGIYKEEICKPSDLENIHKKNKELHQQRQDLMEKVCNMRSQKKKDRNIITFIDNQREKWEKDLTEIANDLKEHNEQLLEKKQDKRKPEDYFTKRWING